MPRSLFLRTVTLFVLMAVKNRVQLAFLADGRRRARKAARDIGEPNVPGGIDYALWSKAVKPASREGFADPLDFVDLAE